MEYDLNVTSTGCRKHVPQRSASLKMLYIYRSRCALGIFPKLYQAHQNSNTSPFLLNVVVSYDFMLVMIHYM